MWRKIKASISVWFSSLIAILDMALFPGPRYAAGGYACELCGQEVLFYGRLDDPFSFTKPKRCHLCQRKICSTCHKASEEVSKHGQKYILPVCRECFTLVGNGNRYVSVRAAS